MKKKVRWLAALLVVLAAAVAAVLASADGDEAPSGGRVGDGRDAPAARSAVDPHADNPMVRAILARPWADAPNLSEEERALIEGLVRELEGRLWHPSGQMALLEDLVGWLRERYPDSWRAELERILRAAFPSMADELLRLWDGRDRYEDWMREHRAELMRLPRAERRERIWEARQEHFGDAAEELYSAARRSEGVASALERIDADPNASVEERFEEYLGAIEEQYGDQTEGMLAQRRQEVLDRFLALSSVQSELAELDAEERYARLRAIREAAGMDQAALDRWTDLDQRRDRRWESGGSYMRAREELLSRYEGDDLQQRLRELREEHFGQEADTVAHEEETGHFRFERQRTYGQN